MASTPTDDFALTPPHARAAPQRPAAAPQTTQADRRAAEVRAALLAPPTPRNALCADVRLTVTGGDVCPACLSPVTRSLRGREVVLHCSPCGREGIVTRITYELEPRVIRAAERVRWQR